MNKQELINKLTNIIEVYIQGNITSSGLKESEFEKYFDINYILRERSAGKNLVIKINLNTVFLTARQKNKKARERGYYLKKYCSVCRTEKPYEAFANNRLTIDGKSARCRACSSIVNKEYRNRKILKELENE